MRFQPVTWSFFDPEQHRYTVLSAEIDSRVVFRPPDPQSAAPSPTTVNAAFSQKLAARSGYLLAVLVAVFALVAVVAFTVRKRKKPASETSLPDDLIDVKKMLLAAEEAFLSENVVLFYNIVFEIIQNMESVEKHYNKSVVVTAPLKNKIRLFLCEDAKTPYKQSASDTIKALAIACDRVRYGRIMPDSATISADFESLRQTLSSRLKPTT
jgi:hypothetical protein